jgi:hypothetical protein
LILRLLQKVRELSGEETNFQPQGTWWQQKNNIFKQTQANSPYLHFNTIQMSQLSGNPPPSLNYGGKQSSQNYQGAELLYKIFRGDTKLVRSVLEANYF